jgi:hypothetical protein
MPVRFVGRGETAINPEDRATLRLEISAPPGLNPSSQRPELAA